MMIIFTVIVSFLLHAPVHGIGGAFNSNESLSIQAEEPSVVPKKWISKMIADVETNFDMNLEVSDECRRDFNIYRLHVQNQTIWAIRSEYFIHLLIY